VHVFNLNRVSPVMCAELRGNPLPFPNQTGSCTLSDCVSGFEDRTAVSVAEAARNFLRRNKPLANRRKQGLDSLRNGL